MTGIDIPAEFRSAAAWARTGEKLGTVERAVMWKIGEWWNAGERFGDRVRIVTAPGWAGPSYQTCRTAGSVARRFPLCRRLHNLPFGHHHAVASLPDEQARPVLDWAAQGEDGPRSERDVRTRVKTVRRDERERDLGEATRTAAAVIGGLGLFNVILADPPWRFEPWSQQTGMDRAAENHYPTMTIEAIRAIDVPAADDCVLFLWATNPMLPAALDVMAAWRFTYRTNMVWAKDRPGLGYWTREFHELLLIGSRGNIPAPAPGKQYDSVQRFARLAHSQKPEGFAEIIEDMFPTASRLEMFARRPRLGWQTWGNEAGVPPPDDPAYAREYDGIEGAPHD